MRKKCITNLVMIPHLLLGCLPEKNPFMLYCFFTQPQPRASSNRNRHQQMGKMGGKCLGQCLSSFPACLLTDLVENQGGEQKWVGRRKQAPLLPGKVPVPSPPLLSPGAASPKQCLAGSICLPALPPSPPWKSLFPQQPAVPPRKERYIFKRQRGDGSRILSLGRLRSWFKEAASWTLKADAERAHDAGRDALGWLPPVVSTMSLAQARLHGGLILQHLILMVLKPHVAIRLYPKAKKFKKCDCSPAFFTAVCSRDEPDCISSQHKAIKRI